MTEGAQAAAPTNNPFDRKLSRCPRSPAVRQPRRARTGCARRKQPPASIRSRPSSVSAVRSPCPPHGPPRSKHARRTFLRSHRTITVAVIACLRPISSAAAILSLCPLFPPCSPVRSLLAASLDAHDTPRPAAPLTVRSTGIGPHRRGVPAPQQSSFPTPPGPATPPAARHSASQPATASLRTAQ